MIVIFLFSNEFETSFETAITCGALLYAVVGLGLCFVATQFDFKNLLKQEYILVL